MTETQERITIAQIMGADPLLRRGLAKQKMKGTVGFVKDEPRHVVNKPGAAKSFSFYTQRISLVQGDDEIYVELSIGEDASRCLSRADKGKEIELWNVSVNMYETKEGGTRTELRASGEVIGGLAPKSGGGGGAGGSTGTFNGQREEYILIENINTAVSVILAAAVGNGSMSAAQAGVAIEHLVHLFYDADKAAMALPAAVPAAPVDPAAPAQIQTEGPGALNDTNSLPPGEGITASSAPF